MNRWHNLTERERWMVAISLLCIVPYLFYQLIYSPLTMRVTSYAHQLGEKQETLIWMQQVRSTVQNKKTPQVITNPKLLTLVANQLHNSSFHQFAYQLKQTGADTLQLSYDRVPLNPFLSWLWSLSNDYKIFLKQFNAEYGETPGVVKLTVVMAVG